MTEKFEFIDAEYGRIEESDDEYVPSIVMMCRWMKVSARGSIEWRSAPESATARRRGILALIVRKSFDDSDETYGYRRVHADLVAWGVQAGPELVRSIMRELGLEPCQPRPWRVSLTEGDGQEHGIPDLVQRDFTAAAPGALGLRRVSACRPQQSRASGPPGTRGSRHQAGYLVTSEQLWVLSGWDEVVFCFSRNVTNRLLE